VSDLIRVIISCCVGSIKCLLCTEYYKGLPISDSADSVYSTAAWSLCVQRWFLDGWGSRKVCYAGSTGG
jgi:hypothetical protein